MKTDLMYKQRYELLMKKIRKLHCKEQQTSSYLTCQLDNTPWFRNGLEKKRKSAKLLFGVYRKSSAFWVISATGVL